MMKICSITRCFLAFLSFVLTTIQARGEVGNRCIEVTTIADEDDASLAPGAGRGVSLREAIKYGEDGAVVTFARSLNGKTITLGHPDGQLVISKSLTVDASDLSGGITIDANGQFTNHRIFKISAGTTVALSGMIFTGGQARGTFPNDRGGAIYCDNATLTLSGCIFSQNFASFGGGVYCTGLRGSTTLHVTECTFRGNYGANGGGIGINSFLGKATVSVSESVFLENSSFAGGGIHSVTGLGGEATLSLERCTFSGNVTDDGIDGGGGIYNGVFDNDDDSGGSAILTLTDCLLTGNSGDLGGGILNEGAGGSAILSLTNCTLSGNFAKSGGGIYSVGSGGNAELSMVGCTLSGNSARLDGGGIFSSGAGGVAALDLRVCTLAGNSARIGGGIIRSWRNAGSVPMTLTACTITENSSTLGGGIYRNGGAESAPGSLTDCILAGNTAMFGPDLQEFNSALILMGTNLIGEVGDSGFATVAGLLGDSERPVKPVLMPLGDYGGPTQTMPPLPGSPALDATSESTRMRDQRGLALVGVADIGAAEFQGRSDLGLIWDSDFDADGNSFGVEFALGTDPRVSDAGEVGNLEIFRDPEGGLGVRFGYNPTAVGFAIWKVEQSNDLENWSEIFSSFDPGGESVLAGEFEGRGFYRIVVGEAE